MWKKRPLIALLGAACLLILVADFSVNNTFWYRYIVSMTGDEPGMLKKIYSDTEEVTSKRLFEFPVAKSESERTVEEDALRGIVSYAKEFNSYAMIVLHRGIIQLEWYAPGFDRQSIFPSQSMHKTVQAIMIGIAIDEGLIKSIRDPVGRYIEEWADDDRGGITIEQLLMMASGLREPEWIPFPWASGWRWLYSDDTLRATLKQPLSSPPGQAYYYNDFNPQVLGIVLERVTERRYADYLALKLWQPLGAQTAKVWLDHEGGSAMHACCLLASPMDWARVGFMLQHYGVVNERRIVSSEWVESMTLPNPFSPHYGYLTRIGNNEFQPPNMGGRGRSEDWLVDDVFYLTGHGGQRVVVSRSKALVVVRMGPSTGFFPELKKFDNSFFLNKLIRGIKQ